MNNPVMQFRKFARIPPVSSSHKITCYPLYGLESGAAFRACLFILRRILIAAVGTMVAVVVHRAVTEVVLIHHIDDLHDRFLVMSGVTVDFHIEYVTSSGQR